MINFNDLFGVESGGDKIAHFLVGVIIGIASFFLIQGIYVVVPVIVAGLGKELYGEYKYGGFDFFDLFATITGGWIAIIGTGAIMGFIG